MGQPIRGMTRPLPVSASIIPAVIPPEVVTLNKQFNASIHNRFDVEVIDAQTGKVKQRAQAENTICTQLWTRLFSFLPYFNYIHYGTGNGTPAAADTHLFTFLGYGAVSGSTSTIDRLGCVYSTRKVIQLLETTAVGATLTEVGIAYDTTSETLCTHAMLKDANGNQISIAKTNTDIVNIYATVFVHWPTEYNSGSIMFCGDTGFLSYLAGTPGVIPSTYRAVKGRRYYAHDISEVTLSRAADIANKKYTLTATRLAAASGNISGGISNVLLGYAFALKPPASWFLGSDIIGEAVATGDGVTTDFALKFDYPEAATVYVDGVAQSGVTVDKAPTLINNMACYFEEIEVVNGVAYPAIKNHQYSYQSNGTVDGLNGTYYNPNYQFGIKSYICAYNKCPIYVKVSNDLVTWVDLGLRSDGVAITVPAEYRNYKYWDISGDENNYGSKMIHTLLADTATAKNIHFTTPPASGAVITADYHTPTIAKDANHVFDLTVTIQLGEHTA